MTTTMLKGNFNILHHVSLRPESVSLDGKAIDIPRISDFFLSDIYHFLNISYPKFFKMDVLCKTGFLSSEILLDAEGSERFVPRDDRAVILFNKTSSVCTDKNFTKDIINPDDFYPKPSLFVYTLPNIVTGEISIRNKYFGESSLMVLDEYSEREMSQCIERAFTDEDTKTAVAGWIDAANEHNFESELFIIEKNN